MGASLRLFLHYCWNEATGAATIRMAASHRRSHVHGHGHDPFRPATKHDKGNVWWSNAIFFVSLHIFAIYGALFLSPLSQLCTPTLILCFFSWQLASFGITIGYHRLWSHRAFTATMPLRVVLAWMASMGFQGSCKWWVLRHRLHHRFTDDPKHDPYSASNGLWWSHCGWIFWKPSYPRMKLIERADLESDPVVRFQHKYYVPIALFSGLILPTLIGATWGDALGGLVWGGAVARLLIWHTTFCINSLAHWTGLQPYTEEVTARGNYLLAVLTSGEGNHNFHHAFPKDFRNGPHPADWDPSKWFIYLLHHYTPFVPSIARTPESAILKARASVHTLHAERLSAGVPSEMRAKRRAELPVWSVEEAVRRNGEVVFVSIPTQGKEVTIRRRRVLVLVDGCLVDVGGYLEDHPGGEHLLLANSIRPLSSTLDFSIHTTSTTSPTPSSPNTRPVSPDQIDSGYSSGSQSSPIKKSFVLPSANASSGLVRRHRSSSFDAAAVPALENDDLADMEEAGEVKLRDATKAFFGGMNNHSGAAKEMMRTLRVAVLQGHEGDAD